MLIELCYKTRRTCPREWDDLKPCEQATSVATVSLQFLLHTYICTEIINPKSMKHYPAELASAVVSSEPFYCFCFCWFGEGLG